MVEARGVRKGSVHLGLAGNRARSLTGGCRKGSLHLDRFFQTEKSLDVLSNLS